VTAHWISYIFFALATLTLLLPIVAGGLGWADLSRPQRVFLAYVVLELVIEAVAFVLGRLGRNNLWIGYSFVPVESALIVAAFALWQVDQGTRAALQIVAPAMLLFWLPPLLGWEDVTGFSFGVDVLQGIICLIVAAYTVVRRAQGSTSDIQRNDWFYIGSGVMLYFATYALIDPLNRYLLKVSPDTVFAVLTVRAGFQILANVLYYHGMRCRLSPQSSGRSSLPRPPWSPSSWSRSVQP
jgi:hypothetical protein